MRLSLSLADASVSIADESAPFAERPTLCLWLMLPCLCLVLLCLSSSQVHASSPRADAATLDGNRTQSPRAPPAKLVGGGLLKAQPAEPAEPAVAPTDAALAEPKKTSAVAGGTSAA